MDNHRLHDYDETEVVISKRSTAVSDSLKVSRGLLVQSQERADFSDLREKLATCHNNLKFSLQNYFGNIHKQLHDREKYLLQCLQDMIEKECVKIENAEKEFAKLIAQFESTLLDANRFLDGPKSASLIAEGKGLLQDLEKIAASMKKLMDFVTPNEVNCVQLIFTDEDNVALKTKVAGLGSIVSAHDSEGVSPASTRRRLHKNVSLPAMSSFHSISAQHTEALVQPAAVITCTEKGKKFYPRGIAVGSNNLITVSDLHNNFVKVLTGTGKVIDTIESSKGSHALKGPCAINVDEDNDIYILERDSKGIRKYTNGSLVDLGKFSKQFDDPRGILVLKEKVYVSDWKRNCIHVLSLACNKLSYQSSIGEKYLKQPAGIAYDRCDGKLVVCDQENHCVWVITPGGEVINVIGGDSGVLHMPYGVAVTSDGKVVVSEKGKCCLSVFALDGSHLFSFGTKGSGPGQFNQLRHICTNFNKQILVADELNQRVQIFDNV